MIRTRKKKKKLSALDKYVIFSFTMIIIFTIAEIIITLKTGIEQSSLITAFFSVFGGELLLLAMIKRLKLQKGDNE